MTTETVHAKPVPSTGVLLRREYILPFILLTTCFAAWGVANNMTDPLVRTFSRIFTMSTFQSSLVQFSFYGAYFCLAIPAAMLILSINRLAKAELNHQPLHQSDRT